MQTQILFQLWHLDSVLSLRKNWWCIWIPFAISDNDFPTFQYFRRNSNYILQLNTAEIVLHKIKIVALGLEFNFNVSLNGREISLGLGR